MLPVTVRPSGPTPPRENGESMRIEWRSFRDARHLRTVHVGHTNVGGRGSHCAAMRYISRPLGVCTQENVSMGGARKPLCSDAVSRAPPRSKCAAERVCVRWCVESVERNRCARVRNASVDLQRECEECGM